jgi:hypothetical protein
MTRVCKPSLATRACLSVSSASLFAALAALRSSSPAAISAEESHASGGSLQIGGEVARIQKTQTTVSKELMSQDQEGFQIHPKYQ